jgi:hypothetical protein
MRAPASSRHFLDSVEGKETPVVGENKCPPIPAKVQWFYAASIVFAC